jgi:putative peptide zinc metalloprotease protein
VSELKPWARAAVTIWVLSTVLVLSVIGVSFIIYAPTYFAAAKHSLIVQLNGVAHAAQIASPVNLLSNAIGAVMLLLPAISTVLIYLLLCRGIGTSLAHRRVRLDLTLATARRNEA